MNQDFNLTEKIFEWDYDQYDSLLYLTGDVNYELQKELLPYNSRSMQGVVEILHDNDEHGDCYGRGYRWAIEIENEHVGGGVTDAILHKYGYIESSIR